jgi:hypothetical protein
MNTISLATWDLRLGPEGTAYLGMPWSQTYSKLINNWKLAVLSRIVLSGPVQVLVREFQQNLSSEHITEPILHPPHLLDHEVWNIGLEIRSCVYMGGWGLGRYRSWAGDTI